MCEDCIFHVVVNGIVGDVGSIFVVFDSFGDIVVLGGFSGGVSVGVVKVMILLPMVFGVTFKHSSEC